MKRLLVTAAALSVLMAPAFADPAKWTVDPARSHLGFSVQWSGQAFNATFKSWKAVVAFDPVDLAHSKAVVTIDLNSEDSGSEDNDEGLKGAEGFATDKFPAAKFETTGFAAKGNNAYVATGQLSLHGVTKTITLPFTLTISGNRAHMTGKVAVSRIDFGLGEGEWAGDTPIAHAVTITVDLTATRAH
ncbi:MAG: YceI family protein [Alphaproteobacteria bacterium]|nr:YceI family protein [Alphaproteobacteria bacterium]MBL7098580.1 YceI family protein [Alphaproteobacteria bacterium]